MADLSGVLSLIAAYPVHIVTFLGCLLLLKLVIPKRKRHHKHISVSSESTAKKTALTQDEKRRLAEKINENRWGYRKRHAEMDENNNFMIFATIILIGLSLLFMFGLIKQQFQKYFLALILLFIVGVILMKVYKYFMIYRKRKKV